MSEILKFVLEAMLTVAVGVFSWLFVSFCLGFGMAMFNIRPKWLQRYKKEQKDGERNKTV